MTLSLYIARRFLTAFGVVFGAFAVIVTLIDMVDQLRRLPEEAAGFSSALFLAALNAPASLYQILPLVMMLAGVMLFLQLARSSELVAIRAAGRSGLRFLVTPVIVAFGLGALGVAVFNPFAAAMQKEYTRQFDLMARGVVSSLSLSDTGLWLRQGGVDGQILIRARQASEDGVNLTEVTFLTYDANRDLSQRIEAESATLDTGAWVLRGAFRWDLTAANPAASKTRLDEGTRLASDLTMDRIRAGLGSPAEIGFWNLPAFISGMETAGFSARPHKVWYQMELAQPLLLAAMVLVAAGFTMRHTRFGRTGVMVLLAILGGFAIFFLRNFAQVLGENGQVPVVLAAWTAPLAAMMLALSLLLHLEDG